MRLPIAAATRRAFWASIQTRSASEGRPFVDFVGSLALRVCITITVAGLILSRTETARAQIFRASFDVGLKAERAIGRAEPWVNRNLELVPGKFGKAVRLKSDGQLIYSAEQNFLSARGTLAFWCRIPE